MPFPLAELVLRGSGLVPDFRVFQFDVAANLSILTKYLQQITPHIAVVAWWWARDPAEPDAGDGQGPVETVDLTRIGTGPTPSLTACQGTQARQHESRIP